MRLTEKDLSAKYRTLYKLRRAITGKIEIPIKYFCGSGFCVPMRIKLGSYCNPICFSYCCLYCRKPMTQSEWETYDFEEKVYISHGT